MYCIVLYSSACIQLWKTAPREEIKSAKKRAAVALKFFEGKGGARGWYFTTKKQPKYKKYITTPSKKNTNVT